MLKVSQIYKSFEETEVLHGVSLEIKRGQVVALLGPNGAGKTTLMRIIVGFLTANKGKVIWRRKPVDNNDRLYRSKIGYLPENNPLYLNMYPAEYLRLVAELKGIDKKEIKEQTEEAVKACGVGEMMAKKIDHLSRGYKQRLGLAATLLGKPEILILDEPTSGLDPNQIIEIRKLIKKLAKNKMVLLSTHILTEAREMCDRIVIINRGKIVLDEETKKISNLEKKFVELTG